MPTNTTNFGLNKPLANDATDEDLWGGYLNDNWDDADDIMGREAFVVPIEAPADKKYVVTHYAPFPMTIEKVVSESEAGTAAATVAINGTSLGGTANSVSTTTQTQSHSSANSVAEGDEISITLSSTSSDCTDMSIVILGKRTGAGAW